MWLIFTHTHFEWEVVYVFPFLYPSLLLHISCLHMPTRPSMQNHSYNLLKFPVLQWYWKYFKFHKYTNGDLGSLPGLYPFPRPTASYKAVFPGRMATISFLASFQVWGAPLQVLATGGMTGCGIHFSTAGLYFFIILQEPSSHRSVDLASFHFVSPFHFCSWGQLFYCQAQLCFLFQFLHVIFAICLMKKGYITEQTCGGFLTRCSLFTL